MSAQHTPGPWFYRKGDEWSHSVVTKHGALPDGTDNCWTVASINEQREPEHEANACLIAAAPELLAALQAVNANAVTFSQGELAISRNVIEVVCAAIAKATGAQA